MVVSAVHGVSTCEFCFPTWRQLQDSNNVVGCGTVWKDALPCVLQTKVSARILVKLKCNLQCKQLKPSIRCIRCNICSLCSLCNLCLHGSTRRTAFGILVQEICQRCSTKAHCWTPKKSRRPRYCFCYCSRCYPALNPETLQGNLTATVLWQKATSNISIHFDTFSWLCAQPWRKEESGSINFFHQLIFVVFTNSVHFFIQFYSLDFIKLVVSSNFACPGFLGMVRPCHFSCLVNRVIMLQHVQRVVKGLKCEMFEHLTLGVRHGRIVVAWYGRHQWTYCPWQLPGTVRTRKCIQMSYNNSE